MNALKYCGYCDKPLLSTGACSSLMCACAGSLLYAPPKQESRKVTIGDITRIFEEEVAKHAPGRTGRIISYIAQMEQKDSMFDVDEVVSIFAQTKYKFTKGIGKVLSSFFGDLYEFWANYDTNYEICPAILKVQDFLKYLSDEQYATKADDDVISTIRVYGLPIDTLYVGYIRNEYLLESFKHIVGKHFVTMEDVVRVEDVFHNKCMKVLIAKLKDTPNSSLLNRIISMEAFSIQEGDEGNDRRIIGAYFRDGDGRQYLRKGDFDATKKGSMPGKAGPIDTYYRGIWNNLSKDTPIVKEVNAGLAILHFGQFLEILSSLNYFPRETSDALHCVYMWEIFGVPTDLRSRIFTVGDLQYASQCLFGDKERKVFIKAYNGLMTFLSEHISELTSELRRAEALLRCKGDKVITRKVVSDFAHSARNFGHAGDTREEQDIYERLYLWVKFLVLDDWDGLIREPADDALNVIRSLDEL